MAKATSNDDAFRERENERNRRRRRASKEARDAHKAQMLAGTQREELSDEAKALLQSQLQSLARRTKGNSTDADADIDFAYRNMALPTMTPLEAPSTAAWQWYIFARNDPDEFLKICAKREDAKAKMAGTITNQRMEDDRRSNFAVIERLEKELTLDVEAIITELMQKFPGDVRRVVAKFDAPAEKI